MGTTDVGTNAILYLGATTATVVEETTDLSIEVTTDTAEDTAHGDTWRTFVPTLSTFDMSIDKHVDFGATAGANGGQLQKWVIDRTVLRFYLYPRRTDATIYWYGTARLTGGGMSMGLEDIVGSSFSISPVSQPSYVHP